MPEKSHSLSKPIGYEHPSYGLTPNMSDRAMYGIFGNSATEGAEILRISSEYDLLRKLRDRGLLGDAQVVYHLLAQRDELYRLPQVEIGNPIDVQTREDSSGFPSAEVWMQVGNHFYLRASIGTNPDDAVYRAINKIIKVGLQTANPQASEIVLEAATVTTNPEQALNQGFVELRLGNIPWTSFVVGRFEKEVVISQALSEGYKTLLLAAESIKEGKKHQ